MSTPKCTYNIRSQLTTFAPGGTWTYVGYNSNSDSGPWGSNPATPLVADLPGTEITRGDDFVIITDSKSFGYYKFNYTVNNTTVSLVVRVIDDTITAGSNKTLSLSPTSPAVNLLTLLGASAGGVWTDLDGAGAAFANNILTPTALSPGTYRFRYNLNNNYTPGGCTSCPPLESLVTVTIINNIFTGRIDVSDDTCAITMTLKNPDNNTVNLAKVAVSANSFSPSVTVNRVITDCNSLVVNEQVVNIKNFSEIVIGASMTVGSQLQATGYLETLLLNNSAGGTITVPLAPSGANQAVFTGVGGSVNATLLTYQGYNNTIFSDAIKTAIVNYLATQNLFENTNYKVYVNTADGFVGIRMSARHNPSSAWLGYNTLTYKVTSSSGNTTLAANSKLSSESGSAVLYQGSPCPSQLASVPVFSDTIIDLGATTYNNIAVKASTQAFTLSPSSLTTTNCPSKMLTAIPLNCNGTVTYLWDYKGATTASIEVTTKGKYKVVMTCSNPAGSKELEYEYV